MLFITNLKQLKFNNFNDIRVIASLQLLQFVSSVTTLKSGENEFFHGNENYHKTY